MQPLSSVRADFIPHYIKGHNRVSVIGKGREIERSSPWGWRTLFPSPCDAWATPLETCRRPQAIRLLDGVSEIVSVYELWASGEVVLGWGEGRRGDGRREQRREERGIIKPMHLWLPVLASPKCRCRLLWLLEQKRREESQPLRLVNDYRRGARRSWVQCSGKRECLGIGVFLREKELRKRL